MSSEPTGLAVTNQTYSGYRATWTNAVAYSSLIVYYRENGGSWSNYVFGPSPPNYYDISAVEGGLVEFYIYWTVGSPISEFGTTGSVSGYTVLRAPVATGTTVVAATEIQVDWTCAATTETAFDVYYALTSGGGWSLGRTEGADATNGTVTGLSGGNTYKFKVVARNSYTSSADSNEVTQYLGAVYLDTLTDTITLSDGETDAVAFGESISDTITLSDSETDSAAMSYSTSDTITLSDIALAGQSIRSDYDYYIGTADGYVHRTAVDLLSDNGASITSSWRSKVIDFAEVDSENTGKWKTIYRIEYIYKEIDSNTVTVFKISNDGGNTWTTQSKTLGDHGDGRIEHSHFHWVKTGQFFTIVIEWPSTDKEFQFLGFDIVYDDSGEQYEVV